MLPLLVLQQLKALPATLQQWQGSWLCDSRRRGQRTFQDGNQGRQNQVGAEVEDGSLELKKAERLYNQRREAVGPGHRKRFRRLPTLRAKDLRHRRPESITLAIVKC